MAGYLPGVRQGAVGGMSQLAAALGQGGQLEQRAFDAENLNQSRIAQALATIRHLDAQTGETGAKTDFLRNRPALYQQQAALASDTDVPTIQAFLQKLTTGKAPQVPMGPEAPDGSMGVGSQQFDPAVSSRIALALQRNAPLIADGGHIGAGDWAGALDKYREADLSGDVLAGTRQAGDVGRAQAAAAGKPLFSTDNLGQITDVFGGQARGTGTPAAQGKIDQVSSQIETEAVRREGIRAQAERDRAAAAKDRADGGPGGKAPPGYRVKPDGTLEAIPGGPADPKVKREGQKTGMSPTLQKELIESDEAVQSGSGVITALKSALAKNDVAYSGLGALTRAKARSNVPGMAADPAADATVAMDNLIVGQALTGLKAAFGGNPTEGERKILLDVQASVDKTPAQRKEIIQRAIAAAQRRGQFAASKAKAIRDGTYLTDGIQAPDAPPPADGGGPARVQSDADYNALPNGATFIGPDGKTRRKP